MESLTEQGRDEGFTYKRLSEMWEECDKCCYFCHSEMKYGSGVDRKYDKSGSTIDKHERSEPMSEANIFFCCRICCYNRTRVIRCGFDNEYTTVKYMKQAFGLVKNETHKQCVGSECKGQVRELSNFCTDKYQRDGKYRKCNLCREIDTPSSTQKPIKLSTLKTPTTTPTYPKKRIKKAKPKLKRLKRSPPPTQKHKKKPKLWIDELTDDLMRHALKAENEMLEDVGLGDRGEDLEEWVRNNNSITHNLVHHDEQQWNVEQFHDGDGFFSGASPDWESDIQRSQACDQEWPWPEPYDQSGGHFSEQRTVQRSLGYISPFES